MAGVIRQQRQDDAEAQNVYEDDDKNRNESFVFEHYFELRAAYKIAFAAEIQTSIYNY